MICLDICHARNAKCNLHLYRETTEQIPQSGFNLGSIWLQHGTNMAPIRWFCQAAAKFVVEQKMWLKKLADWSGLECWAVWCGVPVTFRYIDSAGEVTWILWQALSPVIPAVNGMKKKLRPMPEPMIFISYRESRQDKSYSECVYPGVWCSLPAAVEQYWKQIEC